MKYWPEQVQSVQLEIRVDGLTGAALDLTSASGSSLTSSRAIEFIFLRV